MEATADVLIGSNLSSLRGRIIVSRPWAGQYYTAFDGDPVLIDGAFPVERGDLITAYFKLEVASAVSAGPIIIELRLFNDLHREYHGVYLDATIVN